ncbi:inhibitor of KinA [Neolewinella xylanilytica]|uniref:Inhibitor of KinA n=1 Tax=Neolewinella xylanilytica TaxID=1514080 RepID=A0A2S6I3X4_9BACT|nr:5-oxoprolinase subunit PxpB [Neolewinella xylanilytica]PPK85863.1 inhibitor of KinA [Neolewinella xylanilytica]
MRTPRSIKDFGPEALLLEWEQRIDPAIHRGVMSYAATLGRLDGVAECIPSYASLLVRFDGPADRWRERLYALRVSEQPDTVGSAHRIPVCYGGEYGPDLADVGAASDLSEAEVVRLHTRIPYRVYLIGYRPGFAFMGELDPRIAVARRDDPRRSVPAGSVGLAGTQTGIYPVDSPGGWQLIGYCPLPLLDKAGRTRFQTGDLVTFHAVDADQLEQLIISDAWPND